MYEYVSIVLDHHLLFHKYKQNFELATANCERSLFQACAVVEFKNTGSAIILKKFFVLVLLQFSLRN